eukprot:scaffold494_cov117-Isochrysis_galbana.AAC.2
MIVFCFGLAVAVGGCSAVVQRSTVRAATRTHHTTHSATRRSQTGLWACSLVSVAAVVVSVCGNLVCVRRTNVALALVVLLVAFVRDPAGAMAMTVQCVCAHHARVCMLWYCVRDAA